MCTTVESVGEGSYFCFCRVSAGGRALVASVTSFIVVTGFTCFLFSPYSSRLLVFQSLKLLERVRQAGTRITCVSHFQTEKLSWTLQVGEFQPLPSPLPSSKFFPFLRHNCNLSRAIGKKTTA